MKDNLVLERFKKKYNKCTRRLKRKRKAIDSNKNNYAVIIQKIWRGFRLRKVLNKFKHIGKDAWSIVLKHIHNRNKIDCLYRSHLKIYIRRRKKYMHKYFKYLHWIEHIERDNNNGGFSDFSDYDPDYADDIVTMKQFLLAKKRYYYIKVAEQNASIEWFCNLLEKIELPVWINRQNEIYVSSRIFYI